MDDPNIILENSNRESTKGEPSYISDIPYWILEKHKEVWDTRTIIGNNISVASNNAL